MASANLHVTITGDAQPLLDELNRASAVVRDITAGVSFYLRAADGEDIPMRPWEVRSGSRIVETTYTFTGSLRVVLALDPDPAPGFKIPSPGQAVRY